jgi:hypothetical protein
MRLHAVRRLQRSPLRTPQRTPRPQEQQVDSVAAAPGSFRQDPRLNPPLRGGLNVERASRPGRFSTRRRRRLRVSLCACHHRQAGGPHCERGGDCDPDPGRWRRGAAGGQPHRQEKLTPHERFSSGLRRTGSSRILINSAESATRPPKVPELLSPPPQPNYPLPLARARVSSSACPAGRSSSPSEPGPGAAGTTRCRCPACRGPAA